VQIKGTSRPFSLFLATVASISIGVSRAPAQATQVTQGSQPVKTLTLEQAEDLALKNHPRIASSSLRASAAGKVVSEARAAYFPTLSGFVTGTFAEEGTVIASGTLQTSGLSSRAAVGAGLNQLVTDFGRTFNLVRSARLLAEGQKQVANDTRAQVFLYVRQAYYQVLATESVQNAARAALENRRLTLRQVSALAQSEMRSTLDVDFAQVLVSEAELIMFQAESNVGESKAQLTAAMGDEHDLAFTLVEEPLPAPLEPNVEGIINRALLERPDLQALRFNGKAAHQFAQAEKKLSYPTVNLLAQGGKIPRHDSVIHVDEYGSAGVNINVPIFNGNLYSARHGEAELRARAADKDIEDLKVKIARDVRIAWFEASNAFRRLDVTARLVRQANEALRLAQARYESGLGSIVELNQAQLSQTSAEISAASAKYEYLGRRAILDYTTGIIR
jgi:outer membrane protein